jgi:hypothetical protein
MPRRGGVLRCVPDWLPPLVNAGRAFIAVGVVEFFWIVTALTSTQRRSVDIHKDEVERS